jgi:hypothetical protein
VRPPPAPPPPLSLEPAATPRGQRDGQAATTGDRFFCFVFSSQFCPQHPIQIVVGKRSFSFKSSVWDIGDFQSHRSGRIQFYVSKEEINIQLTVSNPTAAARNPPDESPPEKEARRPTPPHREEEPLEGATLRDPPFPKKEGCVTKLLRNAPGGGKIPLFRRAGAEN